MDIEQAKKISDEADTAAAGVARLARVVNEALPGSGEPAAAAVWDSLIHGPTREMLCHVKGFLAGVAAQKAAEKGVPSADRA